MVTLAGSDSRPAVLVASSCTGTVPVALKGGVNVTACVAALMAMAPHPAGSGVCTATVSGRLAGSLNSGAAVPPAPPPPSVGKVKTWLGAMVDRGLPARGASVSVPSNCGSAALRYDQAGAATGQHERSGLSDIG